MEKVAQEGPKEAPKAEPGEVVFDDGTQVVLESVQQALGEGLTDGLVTMAAHLATTTGGDIDLDGLVSKTRTDNPDQLKSDIHHSVQSFQSQADKAIQDIGISDPWEFYGWARKMNPRGLRDAIQELAYGRSTRAFIGMAQDYRKRTGK